MKPFIFYLVWSMFALVAALRAASREAEWKKVEKLVGDENHQSAMELLKRVEAAARDDRAWPEAVKAMASRIQLEAIIKQDDPALKLKRLEAALVKAPAEMKPLLEAVQAAFYHHYFEEHRWEIMGRTKTADGAGADITTWDLSRLLAEVDTRFQKALGNAAALKKSPVSQWNGLLEAGDLPDSYQPTLYDFIARQALAHYTSAEQAAVEVKAENAFEFADSSPALGSMEDFLAWKPAGGSQPKQRVIQLYQSLLSFHKDDGDPGARVLLNIERLEWAAENATGTGAQQRKLEQLRALSQQNAAHEISLRARAAVADILIKSKKPAEARALLTEGLAAHEKSRFAPRCRNLLKQIEQKSLTASTEFVWNGAGPEISFTCRNLDKVFFRLILVSKMPEPQLLAEIIDHEKQAAKLLRKKPVRAWALDVEPANDFSDHSFRVPAPVDLKPGFYLLAASGNADFSRKKNKVSFAPVLVTPLALVKRGRVEGEKDTVDVWVLDAVSGDPVAGAEVSVWCEAQKSKKLTPQQTVRTDADGFVSIIRDWDGDEMFTAAHDGNFAFSEALDSARISFRHDDNAPTSTFFFTDRAIYRPGQTIQFKGIHVRHDTEKNDYRTLADVKRQVYLKDTDKRELAKLDVVTNAFGSFSGSFTAPQNGITGTLVISSDDGSTNVQVEEYKRPKFKVELPPPAIPPKLGDTVAVKVKALGYTGAPVDGAKVVWRVKREPEWAPWLGNAWWFHAESSEKEVAHGETQTGADGMADVKFIAEPDKTVDEKTDPWFHYQIHADVTDSAGETRSADGGVRAGFVAMKATVSAAEWQTVRKPVSFKVTTATLDGEPLKAVGKLAVHRLMQPERVSRPWLDRDHRDDEKPKDMSDPDTWDTGDAVQRDDVSTNDKGESTVPVKLPAGAYRVIFESKDRIGTKITAQSLVLVVDPAAEKFPVKVPFWAGAPSWELQPGDEFSALWGSGYGRARAFIEIEHRGKIVQRYWTDAARTQQGANLKITEDHRGGFNLHVIQMRENRLVSRSFPVSVPWKNKDLTLKWEHLTSRLEPGAKDAWTLSIAGPGNEKLAAEMAAVLYDASLDAITKHEWPSGLDCFRSARSYFRMNFYNKIMRFDEVVDAWRYAQEAEKSALRMWPFISPGSAVGYAGIPLSDAGRGTRVARFGFSTGSSDVSPAAAPTLAMEASSNYVADFSMPLFSKAADPFASARERPVEQAQSRNIAARKNMQETAFFFPHLTTADDGTVKMAFTMPEAVTTWKFLGFAHDKQLRSGGIEGETVTARELMVQPNPPRFLREGDTVDFTMKITNQSASPEQGTARLTFADAATLASSDAALENQKPEQPFSVPAKESRSVSWRITVPDGQGFLTWKATAETDKMSDGEEGWLPVLPRRILVTESLPLSLSQAGEKEITFKKLAESAGSETLRHQSLTVQMVSQPAWYAVMALPYLMEYPHECSEQVFNRLYANSLARHIAQSDPKIRRIFNLWRDAQPEALESPLLKNQELKSLLIEETPWLREAQSESDQRRNIGILFDDNRLDSETARVLQQLDQMQLDDGSWPWFPGGRGNDFITLYIVAGFGRLAHLGVPVKTEMALEALGWLDEWLAREHKAALQADRQRRDSDHFGSSVALYLYGRSFFLEQRPVPGEQKAAVDYFLAQARKHWQGKGRMAQGHAALGLLRFGDKATAAKIVSSIKERSLTNEETGRYWADSADGWRWDSAPVETQALMIEAFRDIAKDSGTADECALWLLKQKQTQSWPTTKATADAVYALLLGGTAKLSSGAQVAVSLGGKEVRPDKIEAGTGFFEKRFAAAEINADMGAVKLTKSDKGPAWGSVHWQYLEDISKVMPHENTPLKVTKSLFTKVNTKAGPELRPVAGKVKVGDELVVRLEIRTDRDMEFVHLKDQRPSSVEPVNVLSGYKWQDGLGYYESTRDTASHFFFDSLPKGTYVFEYSTRVQLRGQCQTGIAELQCMYAPEFNSHSASAVLEVE